MLQEYLHKIDPSSHPSPLCSLSKLQDHSTKHPGTYGPTLAWWLALFNSGWTRSRQPEAERGPSSTETGRASN